MRQFSLLLLVLFIFASGEPTMAQEGTNEADSLRMVEMAERVSAAMEGAGETMDRVADTLYGWGEKWSALWEDKSVGSLYNRVIEGAIMTFLFGIVFSFFHMLYVKIFVGRRYKKEFTLDYFRAQRLAAGRTEYASEEENERAYDYLCKVLDTWEPQREWNEAGDQIYRPTKRSHLRAAARMLDRAIEIAPTEEYHIELIGSYANTINVNEERYFAGSKSFIWIAMIFGVLSIFMLSSLFGVIFMSLGSFMYYLASCRPSYMLNRASEQQGGAGCLNSVVIGTFSTILTAQTVTTRTTYSDGSRTYSDDYSEHWISWILTIIVMSFLTSLIFVWALISYLRNYVFYR